MAQSGAAFVRSLVNLLKRAPLSSVRREIELERLIFRMIREHIRRTFRIDDQDINDVVFTHGNTVEEKRRWTSSKRKQNVVVFGCSNTSDIFIHHSRLRSIYIEVKWVRRRGAEANTLPGDLQRSIGQSLIASLRHAYVICLVVCEHLRPERPDDYRNKLRRLLWKKHRIALIVRSRRP